MRFLFVDSIDRLEPTAISGRVRFGKSSPFRRRTAGGEVIVSGVVGEAMGQLVSWGLMEQLGFQSRPIYLFSESLAIDDFARPGEDVLLEGVVHRLSEDSVVFSAFATAGGRRLQTLRNCTNYFLPLATLEDPEVTRERYAALLAPGGAPLDDGGPACEFAKFIRDMTVSPDGAALLAHCRIPADEGFYADHFPREPITPIVVLNEVIDQAARRLFQESGVSEVWASRAEGVKIKSFVRPTEEFVVEVRRSPADLPDGPYLVDALVKKHDKVILRGRYSYRAGRTGAGAAVAP